MSRSDRDRLLDVLDAIAAIHRHLARGPLTDGLVFDAVRVRLLEIGEAVKDLPADVLARQPQIPWRHVAAMRDQLAHRYFDTSHAIVQHTVDTDLAELTAATELLLTDLPTSESSAHLGSIVPVRRADRTQPRGLP